VANPSTPFDPNAYPGADRVACTKDEITDMLWDVTRVILERSSIMADRGIRGWVGPDVGMPLGQVMVDDISSMTAADLDTLEMVAKMGRKVGVSLVATAYGALTAHGITAKMRDYASSGNLIALRVSVHNHLHTIAALASLPAISERHPDGTGTHGIGFTEDGQLFRSYWSAVTCRR
jgi:hypothetical protein